MYSPVTLRNYTRTFIPTWNWREQRPTYVIFPRKYGIQSTSLEYTLTFVNGNHKWVTNLWLSHRDRHWHVSSISRIEKTTCNCITVKHNSTYGWWWHALSMDETYIKTTLEASFKLILQTAIHISSQLWAKIHMHHTIPRNYNPSRSCTNFTRRAIQQPSTRRATGMSRSVINATERPENVISKPLYTERKICQQQHPGYSVWMDVC